jgi:hypothetical protein
LTENTADEIRIAGGVEWSDWGSSYTNGNNGHVLNYGKFIFYGSKFTNNGFYKSFSGSSDSFITTGIDTISGTHRATFYNAILSNGNYNVVINSDSGIAISNNLGMNSLVVSTLRSNTSVGSVYFNDNATYSGTMGSSRHIDGYVTKIGNDAFVFPTGNLGKYHPLTISAPHSSSYELSVSYFYDNPATADLTGGSHSLSSLASPLTSIDNTQFWDVVTSSTDSVSVTLHFESLVGKYLNASNVRMVGWNIADARWEIIGTNIPTGLTSGSTITNDSINLSRYSAIGIGSTLEVLPVELLQLSVKKFEIQKSLIQWSTLTEKNNEKFVIEHSIDMINFFSIGEQLGSENSNALINYSFIDDKPIDGINYYRLKQINKDGSSAFSSILSINFSDDYSDANHMEIDLLNTNAKPTLIIQSSVNSSVQISLYSVDGKLVQTSKNYYIEASSSQSILIDETNLWSGIYYLSVLELNSKKYYTFKFVK